MRKEEDEGKKKNIFFWRFSAVTILVSLTVLCLHSKEGPF